MGTESKAKKNARFYNWLVKTRRLLIPHGSRIETIVYPLLWFINYTLSFVRRITQPHPWKKAPPVLQPEGGDDIVNLLTPTFFDVDGAEMCCGGAERYLIELARIIRSNGYRVAIYQMAFRTPWVRWYNDLEVRGIPVAGSADLLNRAFHEVVPPSALTIYFNFGLAYPRAHRNNLSVSHGIWWDHASYHHPARRAAKWQRQLLDSIRNAEQLISVDTNTINWLRAVDSTQSEKCTYIPNFVDTDLFQPHEKDNDQLVILYPRRLYEPRGFWLMAEVVEDLCRKHTNVAFHFVGRADEEETARVQAWEKKYPDRVRWYTLEPEDMHTAYQQADITVVPTTRSEGTSLSCLEAMASGNAVIATNVGGLPNLVFDMFNGRLIEPNAQDLREALEQLITDASLRRQLQQRGREVSLHFSRTQWERRWRHVLADRLPKREARPEQSTPLTFVHPLTQGIAWTRMKQRPQQLFQALAELGQFAFFLSDEPKLSVKDLPPPPLKDWLRILHGRRKAKNFDYLITQPVVYLYFAYSYEFLEDWPNRTVIYDILDDPAIHAGGPSRENSEVRDYMYYHNKLLEEADVVMTSSEKLYQKYRTRRSDLVLIPNGVCPADFQGAKLERPNDVPTTSGNIIGYYGAIAEWLDFDLIETLARQRKQDTLLLIGPTNQEEQLAKLLSRSPNVCYLGEKEYQQLPAYLATFDVAIIPFVNNDITQGVSPLKMFEYMAGGKPVVATDLQECRKQPTVLIGQNADDFCSQIDVALSKASDSAFKEQLRSSAELNSWRKRAAAMVEAVKRLQVTTDDQAAA